MIKTRLKDSDITIIVRELEKWRQGQLGSKLTWAILEQTYGYSRQALQAHIRIKSAYDLAKGALRGDLVINRTKQLKELDKMNSSIVTLKALVADYQEREQEWQRRWQRIAYHVRAKGINMGDIDREITQIPDQRSTNRIISIFDKPLPPSGRT